MSVSEERAPHKRQNGINCLLIKVAGTNLKKKNEEKHYLNVRSSSLAQIVELVGSA